MTARRISLVARVAASDLEWLASLPAPAGAALQRIAVAADEELAAAPPAGVLVVPALGAPRGVAMARVVALARGPWLVTLEPGDRLAPGALERLLDAAHGDAVLAGVDPARALAALADDPRALAGSLVRLDRVAASGWSGERFAHAWELDLWLHLLPVLAAPSAIAPTLQERAAAAGGEAAVRERAVALALALADTPPGSWPLAGSSGRDGAAAALAIARLAARAEVPELLGTAATALLRARSLGAAPPPEAAADLAPLLACLPGLAAPIAPHADPNGDAAKGARAVPRDGAPSIVLEVRSLDPGGLESVVVALALGLARGGMRVAVVCTERGGAETERLRAAGIEVAVLAGVDPAAAFARWLDGRDVDLLNAHFSDAGTPLAAARGIPVVVTLHNEYAWIPNEPAGALCSLDRFVDAYAAVSADAAAFCAERFAIAPARIEVIRNGLPGGALPSAAAGAEERRSAARATLGLPADAVLLLQVGRVDPVKSPLVLVDAVAALAAARPRLTAWIVGPLADREYAERVQARIAAHGLGGRVLLAGRRADVPRLLAAADVFVLPSVIEGLSLAVIEALAAGVPAVLTRTGDAAFLLGEADGVRPLPGALVARPHLAPAAITPEAFHEVVTRDDPERAAALAAALAEVLDDLPARRSAARRRAAEIAPLLAADRMVRAYRELFERVIASRAGRSAAELDGRIDALERSGERAATGLDALRDAVEELLAASADLARERRRRAALTATVAELSGAVAAAGAALRSALGRLDQVRGKLDVAGRLRGVLRAVAGRPPGRPR